MCVYAHAQQKAPWADKKNEYFIQLLACSISFVYESRNLSLAGVLKPQNNGAVAMKQFASLHVGF